MQRLAHETWDDVRARGGRRATLEDLHHTLARLMSEQETIFEARWQRLTLQQRATLRAVVLQAGRELHSADTRSRHRLGGPSSIQTALAALTKQDVLLKEGPRYVVVESYPPQQFPQLADYEELVGTPAAHLFRRRGAS